MDLLFLGLGLGLTAGVSPGPLLTLVIASALERGFGAGLRVALAPLFSDAPIIFLALVVLRELPASLLTTLAALGGAVVIYLGVRTITSSPVPAGSEASAGGELRDLMRGATVNFLNPHPWVAWATVMGPLLLQGWRQSPARGIAFVASFYLAIVGSKVTIAWLVAQGRRSLSETWYRRLLQSCGALLIALGALLILRTLTLGI